MTKPSFKSTAAAAAAATHSTAPDVQDVLSKGAASDAAQPAVEDTQFSYMEYVRNMASTMGVVVPTGKQLLASVVVQLLVGFAGGYAAATLAGYVFVGALVFTSSMFLAYLSMLIVLVVGSYYAVIAAARVGAYVANGDIERDVVALKNRIYSFFKSNKLGAA